MAWFKTIVNFTEEENTIKTLIEELLKSPQTIIEIDFINAKFDLYNIEEKTSIAIDSIGVKVDIVKQDEEMLRVIALDNKMPDTKLTFLKNLVAKEASIRREENRKNKFVNRTKALAETINSLKEKNNEKINTNRA